MLRVLAIMIVIVGCRSPTHSADPAPTTPPASDAPGGPATPPQAPTPIAKRPARVLLVSDSIWGILQVSWSLAQRLPEVEETWGPITIDLAAWGGSTVGAGLIEVADETWAYEGGAWRQRARGVAFSAFTAAAFEFMRNDAGLPVAAYRRGYDKLLAQAIRHFYIPVAANCPPQAVNDASAWNTESDGAITGGHVAAWRVLVAKYNVAAADTFGRFEALVADGAYTVPQLMRDADHPTLTSGAAVIGAQLADAIASRSEPAPAAPEVAGRVVNYLWGQPVAGSWALQPEQSIFETALRRIGGYEDEPAHVSSGASATVMFPTLEAHPGGQVWAHVLLHQTNGGAFTVYVDRGTPAQVAKAFNSQQAVGFDGYFRSILVADGLAAGAHFVEVETTSAAPVRLIGMTYVGVR